MCEIFLDVAFRPTVSWELRWTRSRGRGEESGGGEDCIKELPGWASQNLQEDTVALAGLEQPHGAAASPRRTSVTIMVLGLG